MAERYRWSKPDIALVAATAKTVWEAQTAATRRFWLCGWWISFDGATATNGPVLIELLRASAGITGTTLAANPVDVAGVAAVTVIKHTATVEGTGTTILDNWRVPPTGGLQVPFEQRDYVLVGVSAFLRLRCTAPQGVNATVGFWFEE
jgi:hypothetical protein